MTQHEKNLREILVEGYGDAKQGLSAFNPYRGEESEAYNVGFHYGTKAREDNSRQLQNALDNL